VKNDNVNFGTIALSITGIALVICIALTVCSYTGFHFTQPLNEEAVVEISTETSSGSGVFIGPDGVILTAAHIIDDFELELFGTKFKIPSVITVSVGANQYKIDPNKTLLLEKYDVAIIQLKHPPKHHWLDLYPSKKVPVGNKLEAIGFPYKVRLWHSYGHKARQNSQHYLCTDLDINPGNSGGPILYHDNIVGISSLRTPESDMGKSIASEVCMAAYAIWRFIHGRE